MKNIFPEKRLIYQNAGPAGGQAGNELPPAPVTASAAPAAAPVATPPTGTDAQKPLQAVEAPPPSAEAPPQAPEKPVTAADLAAAGKAAAEKGGRYYAAADKNLGILGAVTVPEFNFTA